MGSKDVIDHQTGGNADPLPTRSEGRAIIKVRPRLGLRIERRVSRILGGQSVFLIILAAVLGVCSGYGAIAFRLLIQLVNALAFPGGMGLKQVAAEPWYHTVLAPPVGGLVVGPLVYFLAREAKGHGVPEVMDACLNQGGRIRPRAAVVTILASALSIGSGGSVGREGPIVQIGSSIGSSTGQFFGLNGVALKTMVACGAAGGIAATFNAPIAGILFATELLLGRGSAKVLSPLVVSSVLATVVTRVHLGNTPAFRVGSYSLVSSWELGLYLVLGLLGAVVGVAFTRGLYGLEDLWEKIPLPEYSRGALGGAMVGATALAFPQVMGVGYEFIEAVLHWDAAYLPVGTWTTAGILVLLGAVKIMATGTTIGSGGSGGVFAPALFIGACLGGAFGTAVNALFPVGTVAAPGAYALVGMGALVAATTHAPLTAMLIVFELTSRYSILLPLMLATIIATIIAMRISRQSIYTLKLIRRGQHVSMGHDVEVMTNTPVSALLRPPEATASPNAPLLEILQRVVQEHVPRLYVVSHNKLAGVISLEDVVIILHDENTLGDLLIAADVMRPTPTVVHYTDSLARCLEQFSMRHVEELPVVDALDELVGVIGREDIIALYNREVLYRDAVLMFVEEQEPATPGESRVRVGSGEVVEQIAVAGKLEGRTLRELDLRAGLGVSVFAVRDGERRSTFPRADMPLRRGQRLEVFGLKEQVDKVRDMAVDTPDLPTDPAPQGAGRGI